MNQLLLVVLACILSVSTFAQITTPQLASPRGMVGCTIGVTEITIDYGRPSVKDREIWGTLVPYDDVWRAGANENTVFTASTDIMVNGEPLPAGSYGLHMIPTKGDWTLIFNSDHQAWGSYFYNASRDVLRVTVSPTTGSHTELLTYAVPTNSGGTASIQLQWENMVVPFTVSVDLGATVAEDLRQQLTGLAGFNPRGYAMAASWLMQNDLEPELAEQWLKRALQGTPDFQTLMMAARLSEKRGDAEKAAEYREQAVKNANNAELNMYGYQLLQAGKVKEAIPLFVLNTQRNPDDPNVWDSLGEAYAMDKQNTKAIECFTKALSMDPPPMVRSNSEKWLKQLQK